MVFVLDINRKPLSPCHEAVARKLLKQGEIYWFMSDLLSIINIAFMLNRGIKNIRKAYMIKLHLL